ncbi:MAG: class II aldolase/adducin family protein, partial [Spirochaetota bacterium]
KKRNAVLLKGAGVLCADGSLDDALASAMIAEKACTIHIQGSYIGGGKAINLLESALMRFVYLKKYSKSAALK